MSTGSLREFSSNLYEKKDCNYKGKIWLKHEFGIFAVYCINKINKKHSKFEYKSDMMKFVFL